MKKLSFILSLLLVIACEEEDGEKSAFVGTWTMTESSGGIYMMVNKAQFIKAGEVDGDVKAALYTDQGPVDSFSMTDFDVNQNMDGTFIMLSTPYGTNLPSDANYQLSDYVSSLDDYDYSQLSVNTMNDYYDFYNMSGNKQYSIETDDNGMNTVSVLDTLYRQIYINGNTVDDSSRYSIVSGTIKEVGTQIQANQPIEMMDDDIGLPSALTLTLNADFTGSVEEVFEGNSMVADIRWFVTPDSLFGWNYCGLDGDDDECDGGPVFNNFKVTESSLVLGMYHHTKCIRQTVQPQSNCICKHNVAKCFVWWYLTFYESCGTPLLSWVQCTFRHRPQCPKMTNFEALGKFGSNSCNCDNFH